MIALYILAVAIFLGIVGAVSYFLLASPDRSPVEKWILLTGSIGVPVLMGVWGGYLTQNPWYGLLLAVAGYVVVLGLYSFLMGSLTLERLAGRGQFCPDCGKRLHREWRACPYCGYELWRQPPPPDIKIENLKKPAVMKETRVFQSPSPPTPALPYLLVKEGEDKGKILPLDKEVLNIGRDESNDLVLHDFFASGLHARIKREGTLFLLYDMASTNGTRVNGKEIVKAELHEGDVIEIGKTRLSFMKGGG